MNVMSLKAKWLGSISSERQVKSCDIYDTLVYIGELSGCHRMPERSFFFRKKQFPVCARCTGAFIGYAAGFICFAFYRLPPLACVIFCAVMFADWLVQRIDILPSTNLRRLITGLLCGFGLRQLTMEVYVWLVELAISFFE